MMYARVRLIRHNLTQKQETFAVLYFQLGNATEAALQAGYSAKTARSLASFMLTKRNIQDRLTALRQKAEDASVATVLERKQKLTEILRADLTDYQETGADGAWLNIGKESPNTGAIAEITSRTDEKDSVITKVKLHSPIQAITELNKMEKVYEPSPLQVGGRLEVVFRIERSDSTGTDEDTPLLPEPVYRIEGEAAHHPSGPEKRQNGGRGDNGHRGVPGG